MKTTSTTIFSCIAAGLLCSVFSSQALAQTDVSPDKTLSPEALEALCKASPSDPRCVKEETVTPSSPASTEPTSTTPTGGGALGTPPSSSSEPSTPAGTAVPVTPGDGTPAAPTSGTTPAPTGGGTPAAPGGTTP